METDSHRTSFHGRKKSSELSGDYCNLDTVSTPGPEPTTQCENSQKANGAVMADKNRIVISETLRQDSEISAAPAKSISVTRALALAAACVAFATMGALVAQSHKEGGLYYFYFVEVRDMQLPWVACCFEVLMFSTVRKLTEEQLTTSSYYVQGATRVAVACVFNSAGETQ